MFVDSVLDSNAMPVFTGKTEEVRDYISNNRPFPSSYRVYEGFKNKLMTVEEYLEATDG